jgi:hypothetical protein
MVGRGQFLWPEEFGRVATEINLPPSSNMKTNLLTSSRQLSPLLLLLVLCGCAGPIKNMQVSQEGAAIMAPQAGKAMIIFMRPSSFGYAIQSSVFEIKDNTPTLVGIVAAKTKIAYRLEPGDHQFMVVGETAEFMNANVAADKTYYTMVVPKMGAWKARFALDPVHRDRVSSEQFQNWLNDCRWVEKTTTSDLWATHNWNSIEAKFNKYYSRSSKEPEQPRLLTVDGL